jgi:alanine racemase
MDQIVLDASDHSDLRIGDTVTLLGRDGEASIEPQEWARHCDSIAWEILCGFRKRLPRVEV